jgi:hypothetical protein
MRGWGAVLLVVISSGCTSVKLVQRDGCWVRRTERLGTVKEEIGPCAKPTSPWADDRLTRLVQECVARDDYRWQSRALEAWNRRQPMPEQAPDSNVLQDCMSEAAGAMITENESLKDRVSSLTDRVADVAKDRDALRARTDEDRTHLLASHDRIADYLGEAANKAQVPAVATATATSEGQAHTENTATRTDTAAPQAAPVTVVAAAPPGAAPVCAPATPAKSLRRARYEPRGAPRAKAPACDQPATASAPAAAAEGPAAALPAVAPPAAEPAVP